MIRAFRHPLVRTRQGGSLLRVRVTTIGPVPVSPEAGPAWARPPGSVGLTGAPGLRLWVRLGAKGR